jgi:hypothetical protein
MTVSNQALIRDLGEKDFKGQELVLTGRDKVRFDSTPVLRVTKSNIDKISEIFRDIIVREAARRPQGVNIAQVIASLEGIEKNLRKRAGSKETKNLVRSRLAEAKVAVLSMNDEKVASAEKGSKSDFVSRRVARFVLYKLAQGGSISAFLSGLSMPASFGTAAGAASGALSGGVASVFGTGGYAHTAAEAASQVVSLTKEILGFLLITEGPGVVGHLARRLTPRPVKAVHNFITPNVVQHGIDWITHTDKTVARGLDRVIDGAANVKDGVKAGLR